MKKVITDRNEAIRVIQTIASQMARKYGYTDMLKGKDRQKGIWGEEFTKFLEKEEKGDCSTVIRWLKPGNTEDYMEFRYRFSNPVIALRFHSNGAECLASLEFSGHRYVNNGKVYGEDDLLGRKGQPVYEKTEVPWHLCELILFNPTESRQYADEMEAMWKRHSTI